MSEGRRGCLKYGCLGCGLLVGIPAVVIAVLLVLGALTGRNEERIEPLDRSQAVPVDGVQVAEPGRIVLDVEHLTFSILPGPAGEPIRLEGQYDAGGFKLDESYEAHGETGWTYRLRLKRKGIGLRPFVTDDAPKNELRLIVPRDTPFVLAGSIRLAESELQLGGLWVAGVDLEAGIGELEIGFDAPTPVPVESFRVDQSVGVLRIRSLGRASPRTVDITRSIGELRVDLDGDWRNDSDVRVSCGIGQCRIDLPEEAQVDLVRGGILIGETNLPEIERPPAAEGTPVLRLEVHGTLGEIKVR
jgi:hypothetical protein